LLELRPDVVIMDITMPDLNGIEAARKVLGVVPGIQVVILSQHNAPQLMDEAKKAGAAAYVVKSAIARELVPTLRAVNASGPLDQKERDPDTSPH
jgi:DNA-binding NarL/FixJ family response regulator